MRKIFTLFAFFIGSVICVLGQSIGTRFQDNGIYYQITSINGVNGATTNEVEVTYYSTSNNSFFYQSTSYTIPQTVNYNGVNYSVTAIGNEAFKGCARPTTILIHSGVTKIGSNAFHNCTGLTSVSIPDGVIEIGRYAFAGCTGLASINVPIGVTIIGEYAFWCCSKLTSISIPKGVTKIAEFKLIMQQRQIHC